jgi:hypothetical protein
VSLVARKPGIDHQNIVKFSGIARERVEISKSLPIKPKLE